jgi:hypothetical protein
MESKLSKAFPEDYLDCRRAAGRSADIHQVQVKAENKDILHGPVQLRERWATPDAQNKPQPQQDNKRADGGAPNTLQPKPAMTAATSTQAKAARPSTSRRQLNQSHGLFTVVAVVIIIPGWRSSSSLISHARSTISSRVAIAVKKSGKFVEPQPVDGSQATAMHNVGSATRGADGN